jgi:hypothetical protein
VSRKQLRLCSNTKFVSDIEYIDLSAFVRNQDKKKTLPIRILRTNKNTGLFSILFSRLGSSGGLVPRVTFAGYFPIKTTLYRFPLVRTGDPLEWRSYCIGCYYRMHFFVKKIPHMGIIHHQLPVHMSSAADDWDEALTEGYRARTRRQFQDHARECTWLRHWWKGLNSRRECCSDGFCPARMKRTYLIELMNRQLSRRP